ncbi:LysR family transcriptional regulator [Modestobacter sp. NPDC049651]|uniref:LysR family transcriptional regulator n=1 Tax=unclassified Modestobacter TaxID=2643866 RepID=UPI0033C24DC1
MELHQLRYLVAVVDEGSFTAAARRERVAQPAVSAAVKQLERELGVALLERGRHGARPTGPGAAVVAEARAALAAVARAEEEAAAHTGLLRGRAVVGMVVGCTASVLADALAAFSAAHPAVELRLVEAASTDLVAGLLSGDLDVAWTGRAEPPPAGIGTAVLYEEQQVAVLAAGSPLAAAGGPLPVADLAGHRLIALPRGTGGRAALEAALAAGGPVLVGATHEVSGLEMVLRLAVRGLGVGFVPASVAQGFARREGGDRVVVRPLTPAVTSRIELAWRAGGPSSPAGRELLRTARAHVARAAADLAQPG